MLPYKTSAGYLFPDPVGAGCLPGPPDCHITDLALGLPSNFSDNPTGMVPGLLINSHVSQIQSTLFEASSWYNSFQANVTKRMTHGLQIQGTFTYGKSIDTTSSSFAGDNYSNNPSAIVPWYDMAVDKGLSDFNVTRNVVINGLWQVPTPSSFHGPLAFIAGGWGLGAVFEASDGTPLWPLSGFDSDTLGMLNGGPFDIPNVTSGCPLTFPSTGRQGGLQYINPSCYVIPQAPSAAYFNAPKPLGCDTSAATAPGYASYVAAGHSPLSCFNLMGQMPRNSVIGPGLINVDMSAIKDTHVRRISESFDVQFRAEFFNLVNRVNYAPPNTNNLASLTSLGTVGQNFGVLTSTQVPMREIQFALKLIW